MKRSLSLSRDDAALLADAVPPLLSYYAANATPLPWRQPSRTGYPDPYRVWISEVMLQQTRIEAVLPYYERFLLAYPTPAALASSEEGELLKLWEGLGYYSRARNLRRGAQYLCERHGGALPADLAALSRIPGVGAYTAGAIASIAFGLPAPAVDGNVMRVLARLFCDSRPVTDPALRLCYTEGLAAVYPRGADASSLTQAWMELGQRVCLPAGAPRCGDCPLCRLCRATAAGCAATLPNREKKKPRRIEQRTLLLLCRDGRFAIRRRPPEGLLASLWEFPSLDGWADGRAIEEGVAALGLTPLEWARLPDARHVFTHIEWQMRCYLVNVAAATGAADTTGAIDATDAADAARAADQTASNKPAGDQNSPLLFVTPDELRQQYALPSAFRALREIALMNNRP